MISALQLTLYSRGNIRDLDRKRTTKLAEQLGFPFDWSLESQAGTVPSRHAERGAAPMTLMQAQAAALLNRYSQRATIFILDKVRAFARENGKKLVIVLNLNADIAEMKQRGTREDQELVDYLVKEKVDYVDMNEIFLREVQKYNLNATEFMKLYLVNGAGHFSPMGNHFIAYSIKDKIVGIARPQALTLPTA